MKRLYVVCDDFGLTRGVSQAIIESIQEGCVGVTSAMMCGVESAELTQRLGGAIEGRIGLHLQLTDGTPCLPPEQIPSLVQAGGKFPRSWRDLGKLEPREILAEWQAQYERLTAMGIRPTHLDVHHNLHRHPMVTRAYCVVARKWGLPARSGHYILSRELVRHRVTCPDASVLEWFGGDLSPHSLVRSAELAFAELRGGQGTIELACHVGHVDDDLRARSTYVEERAAELKVLCHPSLPDKLREAGIELVLPEVLLK